MIFNFNAVEVFNMAIAIEENGKKFYEQSQKLIADSEVKALFAELALQEVEHKHKFQSLKEQLPARAGSPTVWDPENEVEKYIKMLADQHVFVSSASLDAQLARIHDVRDALRVAIEFEKDSIIFFLTMQEETDSEKGREFIGLLVKEEQEHLRRLSLQLNRLGHSLR